MCKSGLVIAAIEGCLVRHDHCSSPCPQRKLCQARAKCPLRKSPAKLLFHTRSTRRSQLVGTFRCYPT